MPKLSESGVRAKYPDDWRREPDLSAKSEEDSSSIESKEFVTDKRKMSYHKHEERKDNTGWIVGGVCALIVIGFILLIALVPNNNDSSDTTAEQNTYRGDSALAPIATFDTTRIAYGALKNKTDPIEVKYTLTNVGQSGLKIFGITTSCHCTTARVVYNGDTSPEFNMSPNNWEGEIAAEDRAAIVVDYDPKKMINSGTIERAIYIKTNDPRKPEIVLNLTAENNL